MAIVGRPNVGKSSWLNALLQEDKAIVTDIAGTTRDIVEGTISIDGIVLNMIDTAGIRKTNDKIEAIGVEKSLNLMSQADLILLVLNNNSEMDKETENIIKELGNKEYLVIVNKIDLGNKLILDDTLVDKNRIVKLSVKENIGLNDLKSKIKELFNLSKIETKDPTYLTNARSLAILKKCLDSIENIEQSIKNNLPIDLLEIDIQNIWQELGKINGTTYDEELLDEMFSRFCLGK